MGTAQVGLSVSNPEAYRERLFTLLGEQDPVEVLTRTPSTLSAIVRTHPAAELRSRPFVGKWTPNEIIGHLADGELVYGYRLRLILCEDNPTILGTKQDLWVERLRYNEREPAELVEMFRMLRELNVAVWKQITPDDMQRTGQHNERGPERLSTMLRMMAGHDLSHLDQITRYIGAVQQRQ